MALTYPELFKKTTSILVYKTLPGGERRGAEGRGGEGGKKQKVCFFGIYQIARVPLFLSFQAFSFNFLETFSDPFPSPNGVYTTLISAALYALE